VSGWQKKVYQTALRYLSGGVTFRVMTDDTGGATSAGGEVAPLRNALSANIRRFRASRGWTQEALADAMVRAGFDWSRVTVAQAENERPTQRGRRVTVEELLGLAIVLETSVLDLLGPDPIAVGANSLSRDDLAAFLVGGLEGGFTPEELTLVTRQAMAEIRYARLGEELAELEDQIERLRSGKGNK
jgi:transcriptional regulator with XRE-family HTH domain